MFFDLIANRQDFLKLSDEQVNSALCGIFPEHKLYSHSVDWRKSDEYILKAKGTGGDVIVGWDKEADDEQGGKGNNKGSIWDIGLSHQAHLRSDTKRAQGRAASLGRKVR